MFGLEIPEDERSTFNQMVWKIVRQIPSGKVSTYGQVAGYIPPLSGVAQDDFLANRARWVGHAMASSPADVPWQRVVNAQGKISVRSGAEKQRQLLEAEGVQFDEKDRIDLKRYGWEGPDIEWLQANGLNGPDEPRQLSFL